MSVSEDAAPAENLRHGDLGVGKRTRRRGNGLTHIQPLSDGEFVRERRGCGKESSAASGYRRSKRMKDLSVRSRPAITRNLPPAAKIVVRGPDQKNGSASAERPSVAIIPGAFGKMEPRRPILRLEIPRDAAFHAVRVAG